MRCRRTNKSSLSWLLLSAFAIGMPAQAIEEPSYRVIAEADGIEARVYEPFWVVERRVDASFVEAGNRAFRSLFNYISGANRTQEKIEMTAPVGQRMPDGKGSQSAGEKIEMTAPVLQSSAPGQAESYVVSFALPSRYRNIPAPVPTDPTLSLREVPARTVAALRYATWGADSKFGEYEKRLRDKIAASGWRARGAAEYARYNAPIVPWFLRRNEVLIEIEPIEAPSAASPQQAQGSR